MGAYVGSRSSIDAVKSDGTYATSRGYRRVWHRDFTALADATLNSADGNTNVILGNTWTVYNDDGGGGTHLDTLKSVNGSGLEMKADTQASDIDWTADTNGFFMTTPIADLCTALANYQNDWTIRIWTVYGLDTADTDLDLAASGWIRADHLYGVVGFVGQYAAAGGFYCGQRMQNAAAEVWQDRAEVAADAMTQCLDKYVISSTQYRASSTSSILPKISEMTTLQQIGRTSGADNLFTTEAADKLVIAMCAGDNAGTFKAYVKAMAIDILPRWYRSAP